MPRSAGARRRPGIDTKLGNRSFRATEITAYLKNAGNTIASLTVTRARCSTFGHGPELRRQEGRAAVGLGHAQG